MEMSTTDANEVKRLGALVIEAVSGMMFRKPPTVEVPAGIADYLDEADMAGTPLDQFAQDLSVEALTVGRVGVLVDHPQTTARVTVAQAQSMGLRPVMKKYAAESIINWQTARIGNAVTLSMVVLAEDAAVTGEDEYAHATEPQYRVLDLDNGKYRQRVYRINDQGADELVSEVVPTMNGAPLPFIPFVIVGVDSVGATVDYPPLIDLVTLNFHHYRVGADYAHGCHISGLPTMFISGFYADDRTIYIGGPSANCLPDPQAKAYFVETLSNFGALRQNLEDKKAEMAILGARMLEEQKRAAETAETTSQHRKGEESLLAGMAQTLSQGVKIALEWFVAWAGKSGEVEFEVSRDFTPSRMTPQELTAMLSAWQAGMPGYSSQAVYEKLQARDEAAQDIPYEEEQARIGNDGPRLSVQP